MPVRQIGHRLARELGSFAQRVLASIDFSPWTDTRTVDAAAVQQWQSDRQRETHPLRRQGASYFSQFDEDGILLAILNRLHRPTGRFLEIGVGNGLENNTLILLAHGWSGHWIGGEPLAFPVAGRLTFTQAWITAENITSLVGNQACDVLSLDLDGNDYWVTERLLTVLQPQVLVLEYNGKFPPPSRYVKPYDPASVWDQTDAHGCALQNWLDLLTPLGYRLVCCSYMGLNAFFVKDTDAFADLDPAQQFIPVRPLTTTFRMGHPPSPRTIQALC